MTDHSTGTVVMWQEERDQIIAERDAARELLRKWLAYMDAQWGQERTSLPLEMDTRAVLAEGGAP